MNNRLWFETERGNVSLKYERGWTKRLFTADFLLWRWSLWWDGQLQLLYIKLNLPNENRTALSHLCETGLLQDACRLHQINKKKKKNIRHTGFTQTWPEWLERFPKHPSVMMLLTGSVGERDWRCPLQQGPRMKSDACTTRWVLSLLLKWKCKNITLDLKEIWLYCVESNRSDHTVFLKPERNDINT